MLGVFHRHDVLVQFLAVLRQQPNVQMFFPLEIPESFVLNSLDFDRLLK